jgi:hypothetical protein
MKASRFSPVSRSSSVQVRSEIVWWSRRYCVFSASGRDFHSGAFFVFFGFGVAASASGSVSLDRLAGRLDDGNDGRDLAALCSPGQDIVAADPFVAGFPDLSRSLLCERPTLKEWSMRFAEAVPG